MPRVLIKSGAHSREATEQLRCHHCGQEKACVWRDARSYCEDCCSGHPAKDRTPVEGWDTLIEVDGKPLLDTTDIRLHFPVDGVARAEVHLALTDEFTFEGQVDLHLHVHLQEGDTMAETTSHGDTNRKFVVIKRGGK